MKKIAVQPEVLKKVGGQINTIATEYERQYNKIYSLVDGINQQWSGADHKAFKDKIDAFKNDFTDMKKIMTDYSTVLIKAGDEYIAAQNKVIEDAKSLKQDL